MFCQNCEEYIETKALVKKWNETGSWYSTLLAYCPKCGQIIKIIKYDNEIKLDINNDERYYCYNRAYKL